MPSNYAARSIVSHDRQSVTIQIEENGEGLAHIVFETPEFDQFIRQLVDDRERLTDEVPKEIDPGTMLKAAVDPYWRCPGDVQQGKALSLRHPGLGWLSFVFPWPEAKALGEWLLKDHPGSQ